MLHTTLLLRRLICFIMACCLAFSAGAQQYLTHHYGTEDGLPHPNVFRIWQDGEGFLWFCTDYGISVYNGRSFNSSFPDKEGLLNCTVLSVFEDDAGVKYANTYKNGLMEITDSSVSRYPIKKGAYPGSSLLAMRGKDVTWVTGKPSLYALEGNTLTKLQINNDAGKPVQFYNAMRNGDDVYFCSSNGLYMSDGKTVKPVLRQLITDTVVDICFANGCYWVGGRHRVLKVANGAIAGEYDLKPDQYVKTMLLDSRQQLWVALDGEGMLQIRNDRIEDITRQLVLNKTRVNHMLEDNEGNIWIATYGGGVFKISSQDILSYRPAGENPNIFCRTLCSIGDKEILIGSIGKISMWRNGVISPYPCHTLRNDQYVYFLKTIGDNLYIGTFPSLVVKNLKTGAETIVKNDSAYAAISMYADEQGQILIGDYGKLYRLQGDRLEPAAVALKGINRYNVITKDKKGRMWYGTDKGAYCVDITGHTPPVRYRMDAQVVDIACDNRGRVWLATNNGLSCLADNDNKTYRKTDGLPSDKCNKLLTDDKGRIWVATLTGLCYIDLTTLKITRFEPGVYNDDILSLYYDNGALFAGSVDRLVSVNTSGGNASVIPPVLYILSAQTAKRTIGKPAALALAYDEGKLVINFIALSFKTTSVEYRYKIAGLDDNWTTTTGNSIELSALPSGKYTLVLNARKDGGPWSQDVTLPITIATPFWKTWWFIALVLLCSGGLLAYGIRYAESKRRHKLLLHNKMTYLKQQALSALINPHFMFNCMNSIQYYLDANENDKANTYLADFAHLIRLTMEDAQKAYISLESELTRIKLYLALEQLRFGDELQYSIEVAPGIMLQDTYIPNMILQPYVENAIWHGIMPKRGGGKIRIGFRRKGERGLQITIEDDGVGLNNKKSVVQLKDGHYGMALTEQRLRLLQRLSNETYSVTAEETTDAQGKTTGTLITLIVTTRTSDISFEDGELPEEV